MMDAVIILTERVAAVLVLLVFDCQFHDESKERQYTRLTTSLEIKKAV